MLEFINSGNTIILKSMVLKSKLIWAFFFVFSFSIAQEKLPLYHDYLTDNFYLVHPSMAGAANCDKLRVTGRKQWLGQEDAPELQTLSYNMRLAERSGIGVLLFNDKNGYHSQKTVKLTYAHHLLFSRDEVDLNQLSFGLSAGFIQSQLDKSSFTEFDPVVANRQAKSSYLNFDVGVSYNFLNFYTHATVQGAVISQISSLNGEDSAFLRNYIFSTGYLFGDKKTFFWEPSVLFQFVDKSKEKIIDVNFKLHKSLENGTLWCGISYRMNLESSQSAINKGFSKQNLQYFTPFLGYNYNNLMIGYTYSKLFGTDLFDNGGFHQITLGLNLFCRKEKYDCYCPAIN